MQKTFVPVGIIKNMLMQISEVYLAKLYFVVYDGKNLRYKNIVTVKILYSLVYKGDSIGKSYRSRV